MSASASQSCPQVSVIIVSWNDWPKLYACLRSLESSALPGTEIIVVDNGSIDNTPENIGKYFPSIRLYRNDRNMGHCKPVNQGMAVSRGRYIFLLDSDTELIGDCFTSLYAFLEARPEVAAVAPRTFNTDGSVQETARNFPTPLGGLFGRQSLLARAFPNNPITRRYLRRECISETEPFEVEQVGSAAILFRRELYEQYGPWDEGYFAYWNDTDWCRRLRVAGERIFCLPTAHLIHHEANSRGKRKSLLRLWLFHYGAWRFYTRWYTFGWWDPRSIAAAMALGMRGGLMLAANYRPRLSAADQARLGKAP
jgi:GT2 family glycosyltransferase